MRKNRIIITILICLFLLLPINIFATIAKVGANADFDGDINLSSGSKVLINSTQISSDALSDVASIAMLDENEIITGNWTLKDILYISSKSDTDPGSKLELYRARDGNPTYVVANNDLLGWIDFSGAYTETPNYGGGGAIGCYVDGETGANDIPGRLEFYTVPDSSIYGVLRMAIDNAGNIKMGDGVWTNYVNISNTGALTLVGTANIEGCNATEFSYLDGVTSDIQDQFGSKLANIVEDTTPELGGELNAGAHSIGFTQQTLTGDGSDDIDWKLSNKMYFTFGAANETFTFTAPSYACNLVLVLKQDATGSRTVTWPATVLFPGGTHPTLTTGANLIDIVGMYWDGTSYYSMAGLDFK